MPTKIGKASLYLAIAYFVVTLLAIALTILFAVWFKPPSPEELGVTASQAPAYLMTIPYHWILNLLVWPPFAWLYLRGIVIDQRKKEAIRLGAFWAIITIVVDVIGWVLVPHPWAMTFKEMYIDYQPWITFIYLIIFFSPLMVISPRIYRTRSDLDAVQEG
jgi:hypothetical protein